MEWLCFRSFSCGLKNGFVRPLWITVSPALGGYVHPSTSTNWQQLDLQQLLRRLFLGRRRIGDFVQSSIRIPFDGSMWPTIYFQSNGIRHDGADQRAQYAVEGFGQHHPGKRLGERRPS
jgi:hypothetical protein